MPYNIILYSLIVMLCFSAVFSHHQSDNITTITGLASEYCDSCGFQTTNKLPNISSLFDFVFIYFYLLFLLLFLFPFHTLPPYCDFVKVLRHCMVVCIYIDLFTISISNTNQATSKVLPKPPAIRPAISHPSTT